MGADKCTLQSQFSQAEAAGVPPFLVLLLEVPTPSHPVWEVPALRHQNAPSCSQQCCLAPSWIFVAHPWVQGVVPVQHSSPSLPPMKAQLCSMLSGQDREERHSSHHCSSSKSPQRQFLLPTTLCHLDAHPPDILTLFHYCFLTLFKIYPTGLFLRIQRCFGTSRK